MPNANYRKGARLERLWINQMKRKGYEAMRSAGSKGLIDCAAWNDDEIIFAQIKANDKAYTDDDIGRLIDMPRPQGVKVFLVERIGGREEWNWIPC